MNAVAPLHALLPAAASCPPPATGPEVPQAPVPIPSTPAPDWIGTCIGAATNKRGERLFPLEASARVGHADGYGTWADAVTAARTLSTQLGRAVGIFDHQGRLYLCALEVPCWFPCFPGTPYLLGGRGEIGIRFRGDTVRGVVQGAVLMSRGDCLEPWVALPRPHG
ncbi:MAG: hypothetical protein JWM90_869 [Thermoleophilia bacterium]|nr:hypothetical protein [Thermoleophilia bacterium]